MSLTWILRCAATASANPRKSPVGTTINTNRTVESRLWRNADDDSTVAAWWSPT